ncbi:hypothetical protein HYH03_016738 [Edaphochlamys debaryana]|uniref:P/Homo B domain-containing protein n=1 Tax=Edaphochlamys debaryana TaxID=47281 RepID=A0A835XHY2_9CHLO|nr:hypothetical protein HYH03_016738 [Edaphochlamys debaryana]|eukprot:KAG2484428.1 hypothetical protein HYH03_016738 [Edaphochlamys debaryana]
MPTPSSLSPTTSPPPLSPRSPAPPPPRPDPTNFVTCTAVWTSSTAGGVLIPEAGGITWVLTPSRTTCAIVRLTFISVSITIVHPSAGDLTIVFIPPPGLNATAVALAINRGGSTGLNGTYVFDDTAGTPLPGRGSSGGTLPPGAYQPQEPLGPIAAAAGNSSAAWGNWTLQVFDTNPQGLQGSVRSWGTALTGGGAAAALAAVAITDSTQPAAAGNGCTNDLTGTCFELPPLLVEQSGAWWAFLAALLVGVFWTDALVLLFTTNSSSGAASTAGSAGAGSGQAAAAAGPVAEGTVMPSDAEASTRAGNAFAPVHLQSAAVHQPQSTPQRSGNEIWIWAFVLLTSLDLVSDVLYLVSMPFASGALRTACCVFVLVQLLPFLAMEAALPLLSKGGAAGGGRRQLLPRPVLELWATCHGSLAAGGYAAGAGEEAGGGGGSSRKPHGGGGFVPIVLGAAVIALLPVALALSLVVLAAGCFAALTKLYVIHGVRRHWRRAWLRDDGGGGQTADTVSTVSYVNQTSGMSPKHFTAAVAASTAPAAASGAATADPAAGNSSTAWALQLLMWEVALESCPQLAVQTYNSVSTASGFNAIAVVSITVSAIMVALLLATAALLLHQRDRNRVADEHSGAAVMPPQAAADDLKPKPAPVPIPSPSPPPPVIGAGGRTVAEQVPSFGSLCAAYGAHPDFFAAQGSHGPKTAYLPVPGFEGRLLLGLVYDMTGVSIHDVFVVVRQQEGPAVPPVHVELGWGGHRAGPTKVRQVVHAHGRQLCPGLTAAAEVRLQGLPATATEEGGAGGSGSRGGSSGGGGCSVSGWELRHVRLRAAVAKPVWHTTAATVTKACGWKGHLAFQEAVKAVRHAGADTQRQELLLSMEGQGDAGALLMVDWDRRNADIKVVQRAPPSSPAAAGSAATAEVVYDLVVQGVDVRKVTTAHSPPVSKLGHAVSHVYELDDLSYGKMPQIKICRYELAEILQLSLLELTRPPQAAAVAAGPAAKPAALIKAPAALESEEEAPQLQPPEESGSPGPDLTSLEAACSALAGSPGFACDAASRRCFLPVPGTGAALMVALSFQPSGSGGGEGLQRCSVLVTRQEPRVLFELSYDTPEDAGVTAAPQPPAASRKMRHEVYAKPQAVAPSLALTVFEEAWLEALPPCPDPRRLRLALRDAALESTTTAREVVHVQGWRGRLSFEQAVKTLQGVRAIDEKQREIFLRVRPNCDSPLLVLDYDKGGVEFKLAVLASADAEGGAGAAGSSVSYDLVKPGHDTQKTSTRYAPPKERFGMQIAHVLELDDLSFGAKDGTIEIRTFRTSNPRSLTLVDVLGKPPPADAPTPPPRV